MGQKLYVWPNTRWLSISKKKKIFFRFSDILSRSATRLNHFKTEFEKSAVVILKSALSVILVFDILLTMLISRGRIHTIIYKITELISLSDMFSLFPNKNTPLVINCLLIMIIDEIGKEVNNHLRKVPYLVRLLSSEVHHFSLWAIFIAG